jgi:hypothetical protein
MPVVASSSPGHVILTDQRGEEVRDLAEARLGDVDFGNARFSNVAFLGPCFLGKLQVLVTGSCAPPFPPFHSHATPFLLPFCRPAEPAHPKCYH